MGAKYTEAQKKASEKYLEDFKCIKVRMAVMGFPPGTIGAEDDKLSGISYKL